MARYIDVNKIKFSGETFIDNDNEVYVRLTDVKQAVEQSPIADVMEVKHGVWVNIAFTQLFKCSECNFKTYFGNDNYCSNCGADMRGK